MAMNGDVTYEQALSENRDMCIRACKGMLRALEDADVKDPRMAMIAVSFLVEKGFLAGVSLESSRLREDMVTICRTLYDVLGKFLAGRLS